MPKCLFCNEPPVVELYTCQDCSNILDDYTNDMQTPLSLEEYVQIHQ